MSFGTLAAISIVAVLGPLLALPRAWRVPVLLGELVAGILLGPTGLRLLHAQDSTFTLLADIGFALIMFAAGSHVAIRDSRLREALPVGLARAAGVGVLAVPLAWGVATIFGTGHTALYAVLMASSSAALVLPTVADLGLAGGEITALLPQVAIADTACIVALPLAIDPGHAGRAALGALAVVACAALLFAVLRSVREVAFTLAPVVLSGFLTLGSCVVIGQPLNFANIIAFPLLFGVGVAFHIYFVMAWRAGTGDLLQTSLARAVVFSALATGSAFGSLWLSDHPGTASMGLILMISLIWTLVCALIFEPALLGPPAEKPLGKTPET